MGAIIKNTELAFTSQARTRPNEFTDADGTTPKLVMDASEYSSQISWICLTSDLTTDITVNLFIKNENTGIMAPIGQVLVPAGAGTNTIVNAVNGLNTINLPYLPTDSSGNPLLNLNYNMNLFASVYTAVPAGKKVSIVVCAADYDVMDTPIV